jgi:hypothetical protein
MDMMNFVKGFAVAQSQGVPQSSAVKYGAVGAMTTGMMSILLPFFLAKQEADDAAAAQQPAPSSGGTTTSTPVPVPNVRGVNLIEAVATVQSAKLVPVTPATVDTQDPDPGVTLQPGEKVTLTTK